MNCLQRVRFCNTASKTKGKLIHIADIDEDAFSQNISSDKTLNWLIFKWHCTNNNILDAHVIWQHHVHSVLVTPYTGSRRCIGGNLANLI